MPPVLRASGAAVVALLVAVAQASAQTSPYPAPTTRMLAIGTILPGANLASVRALLPTEVHDTVQLYLAGKIDQWFSLADRNGVVFLLNVTNRSQAQAMLAALPLGKAHLMHFELMPLAPLAPLRALQGVDR